jgi:hypothetical protein
MLAFELAGINSLQTKTKQETVVIKMMKLKDKMIHTLAG